MACVLHDLHNGAERGVVRLAGRSGNPMLLFRTRAREVWASDYDTIVKLDPSTWRVTDRCRLQGAAVGTMQFIGDFAFDPDKTVCAVARPFASARRSPTSRFYRASRVHENHRRLSSPRSVSPVFQSRASTR